MIIYFPNNCAQFHSYWSYNLHAVTGNQPHQIINEILLPFTAMTPVKALKKGLFGLCTPQHGLNRRKSPSSMTLHGYKG